MSTIPRNAVLTLKQLFNIPSGRAQNLWDEFFALEPDAKFEGENRSEFIHFCSLKINKGATQKPVLTPGWKPLSTDVIGIPKSISAEYIKPFGAFWYGREVQSSNFESIWVHFCKQCWSIDARNPKANGATRIIGEWQPSQEMINKILAAGVSQNHFDMQLMSFRIFHRDSGTFSKNWVRLLIEWLLKSFEGPCTRDLETLLAKAGDMAVKET